LLLRLEDFFAVLPEAEIWVVNIRFDDTVEELARNLLSRLNCAEL
jgi:hypothetical protein